MATPSPADRFAEAKRHAAFIRDLCAHPSMSFLANGAPDKANIPATLFNVTDFEINTYRSYILPCLPPDASKNCRALSMTPGSNEGMVENMDLLADALYPSGQGAKWNEALQRAVMISMVVENQSMQTMFGGSFDFGEPVKAAARALKSA